MGDLKKIPTKSYKFISKFFDKLQSKDFLSDQFLLGFYKTYTKENNSNKTLILFDYYMEYLLRNKNYNISKKICEIDKICENIKKSIINPPSNVITDANSLPKSIQKINVKTGVKTIKLNKKHTLSILSDFIKSSFIITYDNPEEVRTQHDEDFREATTANIIEEIKADKGCLPKAHKDVGFNRRNDMLDIWRHTEHHCVKFIENSNLANILKKVYFINGLHIVLNSNSVITTLSCDDSSINANGVKNVLLVPTTTNSIPNNIDGDIIDSLPCETVPPRWSNNYHDTVVKVLQTSALSETMDKKKKKIKCVMICSGSQMIPGGSADQGIETNESVLYYSSSYNICINQLVMAYPLTSTSMVFLPNILVFKDHTKQGYPMLPPVDGEIISVITVPLTYRPETNLTNQNKYNIDDRLYSPTTKYKNPDKIVEQLRCILNTALFFGYDTVVFDDMGIEDFWLPAHHTAQLMAEIIKQYNGKFKEIIISINKKHLFKIFKKYII
jgi:hypothetical protein